MQRSRAGARWCASAVALALASLAAPAITHGAAASESRVVVASAEPLAPSDAIVNHSLTSNFDVALASAHPKALTTFIAQSVNPASRAYHHFVTPSQYAARFGASPSSIAALSAYLQGAGLRVKGLDKGHDLMHVRGTTRAMARALDASVDTVRLSNGTLVARLASPATLPRALAHDVVGVVGLSTTPPTTPSVERARAVATPTLCPSTGTGAPTTPTDLSGYTVQQQAQLYGFAGAWANGDTGAGVTIGVYELSDYATNDVATYFSCYGVTPHLTSVNVDGGALPKTPVDAEQEATLDVEEAQVLAPGAALVIYQGPNNDLGPTDTFAEVASQDTVSVLTTSWGACETGGESAPDAEQTIFEQMAAQGQTIVAAAGDEGSSDCAFENPKGTNVISPNVDDPASQPWVTGVGGLTVSNIDPLTETVWNDGCTNSRCGAGGGGESALWSRPSWQVAAGIDPATATMRMVPDLSVMGDPGTGFINYFSGTNGVCQSTCWFTIGGTSIGAPLVSALVATATQTCGARLGLINPSLYAMSTTGFTDVTTGSNDLFGVGVYSAGVGYDMASGLGSPNGAPFLAGLCPDALSVPNSTFAVSTTNAEAGGAGASVTATLRDANDQPLADGAVVAKATAPKGLIEVNGVHATKSMSSSSAPVTTDETGSTTFTVFSSIAQHVTVSVTYAGQVVYTTSVDFRASSLRAPTRPSITTLSALSGGFVLTIRPPNSNGGSVITKYQYSLTNGKTWSSLLPPGRRSERVTELRKSTTYHVIVRAVNKVGASPPSPARIVKTLA